MLGTYFHAFLNRRDISVKNVLSQIPTTVIIKRIRQVGLFLRLQNRTSCPLCVVKQYLFDVRSTEYKLPKLFLQLYFHRVHVPGIWSD